MVNQFDLFGFGDALQSALGTCLYAVSLDNNIHSHFVCAKSKVTPLRTLSLPRLELEAALLLSRLCESIKEALYLEESNELSYGAIAQSCSDGSRQNHIHSKRSLPTE